MTENNNLKQQISFMDAAINEMNWQGLSMDTLSKLTKIDKFKLETYFKHPEGPFPPTLRKKIARSLGISNTDTISINTH